MNAARRVAANCMCWALLARAGVCGEELHWSYRPVVRPSMPAVQNAAWPRNNVDRLLLARLEREGLQPAPEAERRTLLRRVSLDLIGLPPTPAEVEAFLADDRPEAFEKQVDRLLASPRFGERWARHWLDLCHYGDSDGHLTDQLRPVAWRYRDWVVQAFNDNLPYDEFTVRQLAGDLLPADGSPPYDAAHLSRVLGTGFLRQTLSNREGGADLEEYRVEQSVDRTSLVGMIWLGLTIGCARCHDHKYDLLTQEEFFRLYAFFDAADEVNIDAPLPNELAAWLAARPEYLQRREELLAPVRESAAALQRQWEEKLLHAEAHPGEDHVWDRQWELLGLIWGGGLGEGQLEGTAIVRLPWERRSERQRDDLLDYFLQYGAVVDEPAFAALRLAELRQSLVELRAQLPAAHATRAPVMQTALTPRRTFIHERGDFRSPGDEMQPGTPMWLPPPAQAPAVASPTRLELARWLVDPSHPLTARVAINRFWQELFGRGIVATPDDFGVRGDPPSHPELLDWLAAEFVHSGWDVKHLLRTIVTSAAYRQSSRPRAELAQRDPDNVLVARQANLRVPAEMVRDSALAVSGLVNLKLGGPCVYPPQPERVVMEAFGSNAWPTSVGADRYRRGLYTFTLRTSPFAQAITFDAPNPQEACPRRDRSNTPLQALSLLNDPAMQELAEALGRRIVAEGGATDEERADYAIRLCLSRPATSAKRDRLVAYLKEERRAAAGTAEDVEAAAWTALASVVMNLHEFITRD